MTRKFFILSITLSFFSVESFAIPQNTSSRKSDEKTVVKADRIEGDRDQNTITAIGNVEVKNGSSTATSSKILYDKENGIIKARGNVRINDTEFGNIFGDQADIKDDFSSGVFPDSTIIFNDGSYLKSQKIERTNPTTTILAKPLFSLCPNDKILKDNRKAGKLFDAISIKSSKTTIDQKKQIIKNKHSFLRIYNFPIFYTPYISIPMKKNKRESGFLTPSYVNNSRFGIGFNIPYFIDAAPNTDITFTPRVYQNSNQFLLKTNVNQLLKYGEHKTEIELANNEVNSQTDTTVVKRTDKAYRFDIRSLGKQIFTTNSSLRHDIHTISDRNYLRDYNFDFMNFTTSKIEYDYTKSRDYFGVKTIRFQELEFVDEVDSAQFVLPSITHFTQSEKSVLFKEKYGLTSNFNYIMRDDGLQYRRLSLTPQVTLPMNFHGNLFEITTKLETDYYSLENNYSDNSQNHTLYDKSIFNYKPKFLATWRLPLIQKLKSNTFMLEPTISFAAISMKKNFVDLPNEDGNNSELTVNNLYILDRIAGYDRSENGERISYGAKSSMFNKLGQFELSLGQSYRLSNQEQDITIRGFNENNKSNIVGQFSYILPQHFNLTYLFQLDESNYSNEVNSVLTSLTLDRLTINNDYLLIRSGVINTQEINQDTLSVSYQLTPKWKISGSVTKNLTTSTNLMRSASVEYGGCCTVVTFSTSESNTSNLTKSQRSYNINLVIRGL